jgi:glycosyltransferase involved in cell wall biosynthesis
VIRLPNGVEFEHFALADDSAELADLAAIPRPRAVYVGALEYWFDADLLASTARALPGVSFVLIGPVRTSLDVAASLPNAHVLGARSYSEIPRYLAASDVAIVPFARDEMVDAIHPIKVYEYLAAGLPVVATRWRELQLMEAPITLTDPGGFAEALQGELDSPSFAREARIGFASGNSWDARFGTVLDAIGACHD